MALAALAACGTVKGDDAMGDDAPEVDTTPPQLMTSTPAADGTRFSVLAPLTFEFDESLDPATVTASSVTVHYIQYNQLVPVIGVVSYDDATKTITFDPNLPLYNGIRLLVRVSNTVKDVAGNAFAGKDFAFKTNTNQITKSVNYNTTTAAISSWTSFGVDTNGHRSRYVYYNSNGPDMQWFTADDPAQSHSEYVYSPMGVQLEYRNFDAGPDGIYNNGDDRITSMAKYTVDARGVTTGGASIMGPGLDQMWGTADDVLNSHYATTTTPNGLREISYNGPGNDGVWKTADDRVSYFQEYLMDDRGFVTRYVSYNAGPDQLAQTTDDVVSGWSQQTLDGNGTTTESRYYNNPGADGMWLTADDVIGGRSSYEQDAKGFRIAYRSYSSPGTDMMWGTADDVVGGYGAYGNNPQGLMTSQTSFSGPGADAVWGTSDDVISGHGTFAYDQNGQRTDQKYYATPGPDNVWRTGDDRLSNDADYDLAH